MAEAVSKTASVGVASGDLSAAFGGAIACFCFVLPACTFSLKLDANASVMIVWVAMAPACWVVFESGSTAEQKMSAFEAE
jgi:hypothetical protein